MNTQYIIQDWAGNHLFTDQTFNSVEDGRIFLDVNVDNSKFEETQDDNDDALQEYYVVPKK